LATLGAVASRIGSAFMPTLNEGSLSCLPACQPDSVSLLCHALLTTGASRHGRSYREQWRCGSSDTVVAV